MNLWEIIVHYISDSLNQKMINWIFHKLRSMYRILSSKNYRSYKKFIVFFFNIFHKKYQFSGIIFIFMRVKGSYSFVCKHGNQLFILRGRLYCIFTHISYKRDKKNHQISTFTQMKNYSKFPIFHFRFFFKNFYYHKCCLL